MSLNKTFDVLNRAQAAAILHICSLPKERGGLSQAALAERLGYHKTFISHVLSGANIISRSRMPLFVALCEARGFAYRAVVELETNRPQHSGLPGINGSPLEELGAIMEGGGSVHRLFDECAPSAYQALSTIQRGLQGLTLEIIHKQHQLVFG